MSATPGARMTRGALALLVLVVLALGGAVAAEVLVEPPAVPAAEPVGVTAPSAGAWYCPVIVTGEEDETAVLSIAAVGEEPATVSVVRHRDGAAEADEPVEVAPGAPRDLVLEGAEARAPSTVRWSGGPVVATWRVEGSDTAGAPCETAAEPVTHITGFETTARSVSRLHLFNPFERDAVVRVGFGTPTGPVSLVLTDNVSVPAGGTTVLVLNDFEPEQPDLAVTVEVLTGRVVTQGTVALAPTANQPGPTGRDVLTGTRSPSLSRSFAYARDDDTTASWLSVYNPNTREAAVSVRVSNPLPDGAALLEEVSVPAGGVVRIDLSESSSSVEFGVLVESVNEERVVVTRLTSVRTGSGAEGVAASAGEGTTERWALVGGGTGDRQGRVLLYNPSAEVVTAAVDAGEGTPAEWASIVLEPNQQRSVELADVDDDRGAMPVVVRADGPLVTDLRTQAPAEGLIRFWTSGGVPSGAWEGPGVRPAVRRDARLSTRPAADEGADADG